jgi:transposase InsO family protein
LIKAIHPESKGTYGSPRIHRGLGHRGFVCGRRRVFGLMRIAGLEGRCKKRRRRTTVADPDPEAANDLIQRHFGPCQEIDRRYVGVKTYIATWEGWAYLAMVIDLASRKVVGWALADHMRTELVEDALTASFANRRPEEGVIFHLNLGTTRARTSPTSPGASAVEPGGHAVSAALGDRAPTRAIGAGPRSRHAPTARPIELRPS